MFLKIVDQFSRFFLGVLFIFSGLIKLNDPVGTQIKMEEYFEVFAEDFGSFFHYLIPHAMLIAMIMIILEVVLGVAVLIWYRMRLTTTVMLLLMIFFTFLTFYSAYFNKVTDCGCFGDAIKLTPWESFSKDVVLMVFVAHLFWYRKKYQSVLYPKEGLAVIVLTGAVSIWAGVHAIRHLPFIDFRSYKIGNNIPEQMLPREKPRIEYTFEKDGEEVRSEKFLSADEGYKYVSSRQLNAEASQPAITDYAVFDSDGNDITPSTFEGVKLLIITVDVNHAGLGNIDDIRSLTKELDGKVEMLLVTSSLAEDVEAFRHEHQLGVPFYFADATVLKTIIRSNPGIALWKNGTVVGKWHHNDTPKAAEILELATH